MSVTMLIVVCCLVVSESLRPRDCSLPVSSVHGILQAKTLEWVAISFSRGSSQPRDWTCVSCIGRRFLCHWATKETWTMLIVRVCVCVCVFKGSYLSQYCLPNCIFCYLTIFDSLLYASYCIRYRTYLNFKIVSQPRFIIFTVTALGWTVSSS